MGHPFLTLGGAAQHSGSPLSSPGNAPGPPLSLPLRLGQRQSVSRICPGPSSCPSSWPPASDQGPGRCLRCCGSAAAIVRTAAARPVNVQSRSSCPSLQTHRTCPRIPPLSLHISPSCTLRPPRQAPLLQGHGCLSPCRAVAGMLSPPSHSPLCRPRPSTDPVGRSPSTSALVLVPLSLWGVGSSRVGTLAFPVLSAARRCLVNYRLHLSQRQKVLFMMLEGPAV